jgi:acyl CoA:acetate/3-ketoacid CoA transferase beta subunit
MGDVEFTRAEVCIAACAEAWRGDGEILGSGMGTIPKIASGLAQLTFEPDLLLTDTGGLLLARPAPVGRRIEPDAGVVEGWMPFGRVFESLWGGRRHVMMGASQIDRFGNSNIAGIGDWRRPTRQLLGVRGAPGNTINHACSYWIPSHTRRVFVDHVDFVSGLGYDPSRWDGISNAFHEIRRIVTNLAVIDFNGPDHHAQLVSIHPHVTVDDVVDNTGFELLIPDDLPMTPGPEPEALRLIREVLDPEGRRAGEVPEPAAPLEGLAT